MVEHGTQDRTVDTAATRPLTALWTASLLAVLAILWQGATGGAVVMGDRAFFPSHQAGAIAVHVLTGATALAAVALRRAGRAPRWLAVLAAVVFAASFGQAALGDDSTLWAHVPGALLLMLGSAAVLVWALLARSATR